MKSQQFGRLRTQYNNDAQYDRQKIIQLQKGTFHNQIQYTQFLDNATDNKFAIKPYDISFLNSLVLNDLPKFKQIKNIYKQYNIQALKYNQKSQVGLHLQTTVMESMIQFLRLMMLAPNSQRKIQILNVAHTWFMKQLKPTTKHKQKVQMLRQIKSILKQQSLLPQQIIDMELPYYQIQEQLKDYKINSRSIHHDLDAPKIQLQNFHLHKVGFGEKDSQQHFEEHQQKKWIQRVVFPNPMSYKNNMIIEEPSQKLNQSQLKVQESPQKQQKALQNQNLQGIEQNQQPSQQVPGQPQVPPEQNQQQVNDLGMEGQDIAEEQQPQIVQQQKKGKLDPLVKVFIMQRQQKKRIQQIQAQKNLFNFRNKKDQTSKLQQQAEQYIRTWSNRQSRFKTQISRKIQSKRGMLVKLKNLHSQQKKFNNSYEESIDKLRVISTIRQAKKMTGQIKQQRLNTQKSFSIYDARRRIKTQAERPKQFSDILMENTRATSKHSYLDEIQDIKNKFAKLKLYAPMNKLMGGLVHPAQKQEGDNGQKLELPIPKLPSNPFFKVAKKKKKKKKK